MPLVVERTPSTERAFSYTGIMRDLFGKVLRDTIEGFTRRGEGVPDVDVEDILGMVMGTSGGIGRKIPIFSSTEEALEFGRTMGREVAPILRRGRKLRKGLTRAARARYKATGEMSELEEAMREATTGQFYREALEVLTGRMK